MKKHILIGLGLLSLIGTINAQSVTITFSPKQYEAIAVECNKLNAKQTNTIYTPQSYIKMIVQQQATLLAQRKQADEEEKLTKRIKRLTPEQQAALELTTKAIEQGKNIEIK